MKIETSEGKRIIRFNIELWRWIILIEITVLWIWLGCRSCKLGADNFATGFVASSTYWFYIVAIWRMFSGWKLKYKE